MHLWIAEPIIDLFIMSGLVAVYFDDKVFWCLPDLLCNAKKIPKVGSFSFLPCFPFPALPFPSPSLSTLFFFPFLFLVFASVADVSPPASEVGG